MVNPLLICYQTGWIILLSGVSLLLPLIPAFIYGERAAVAWFILSALGVLLLGGFLILLGRRERLSESHQRDSLAVVAFSWLLMSFLGSLPYWFFGLDFWSGIFESFSGLSTTGATNIADLNLLPQALLFWRSFSQWLGGMGIIVLMVAVLPFLGTGGQVMFKSEVSGPSKDKLRPRVTQTAKILWGLYLGFSVLLFLFLILGGLEPFEAVCQTFTTISTGGFTNYNNSVLYFDGYLVKIIILIFTFIGAVNLSLYYQTFRGNFKALVFNPEVIFLFFLFIIFTLLVALNLIFTKTYRSYSHSFFQAAFQVVNIVSTAGHATADWSLWPNFSQGLLFLLFFVGGCSGSTSGGVKCIRWIIVFKTVHRAFRRHLHPRGVFPIRLAGKNIEESVLEGVWFFFLLYMVVLAFASLLLTALGQDVLTAFTSVASALGNVGPALGAVAREGTFAAMPGAAKGILSFCMLAGRLEFYSFLVVFFPEFWRK